MSSKSSQGYTTVFKLSRFSKPPPSLKKANDGSSVFELTCEMSVCRLPRSGMNWECRLAMVDRMSAFASKRPGSKDSSGRVSNRKSILCTAYSGN